MHSGRDDSARLQGFARRMRREQTDAERELWSILRDGRLSGYKFRRQVPVAGYIVDSYCVGGRLVIELDGRQHYEPDRVAYDQRRTDAPRQLDITVVRFSDVEMLKRPEAVARTIYRSLQELARPSPQPSPGTPGEGAKRTL